MLRRFLSQAGKTSKSDASILCDTIGRELIFMSRVDIVYALTE